MMYKRMIAGAIGLMAITTTAMAQPWGGYCPGMGGPGMGGPGMGGPGANVDFRIERMTAMLNLSPQQQEQIRALFQEQQGRRQAMQQAMRAQVDAILTPEQRAQHAQMMPGGGRGYGGGRGWGGGPGMGPCAQGWRLGAGGPAAGPPSAPPPAPWPNF